MDINFREARLDDYPEIARLSAQLGYPIEPSEMKVKLEKILSDKDNAIFIAETGNQMIGWVHIHGRHLLMSTFAEVGGLVVDEQYRGHQVGKTLMRMCEEWAKDSGYQMVRVRSGGTRIGAHAFYTNIGYENVKFQQVFNKNLN